MEKDYVKEFNKKYKKNPIISGKDSSKLGSYIPYGISTQSLSVDLAIGCPGIPGARLTQVYGLDGTGKSTLMQHLAAACQAMGGETVLMDTEDAYDLQRAKRIGVDVNRLHLLEPEHLEELIDMMVDFTEAFYKQPSNIVGQTPLLFITDSMEGLGTKAQVSADAEDQHYSAEARVINRNISRLLRKVCRDHKATIVVVSQQYDKIGANTRFGPVYEVKGGRGLKYRASLRMEILARQGSSNRLEDAEGNNIGYRNAIKTWKNKSAPPFQEADYMLTFDHGIDRVQDLFEAGITLGIITGGSAGRYKVDIGKTHLEFLGKQNWKDTLEEMGGVDKVFARFTKYAIKYGHMKNYSLENDDK